MEKGYVLRYMDGSFVPGMKPENFRGILSKGVESFSNAHVYKEAKEALDSAELLDKVYGMDSELLQNEGDHLYLVGTTRQILYFKDLEERLESLEEDKEKDVGICPYCGWLDHDNRFMRCIPCSSNGDRIAMDGTTQAEVNRAEYEKRKEEEYIASLQLYKVIVHSEVSGFDVILTVARSKEEAIGKVENNKKDPSLKVRGAESVSKVDGFSLHISKAEN